MTIKLIVLDIDGILSVGEGQPFDLNLLQRLATLNQQARNEDRMPAVTINTGRPSPYVEAVVQAISGWQPALYESGAGLFYPETNRFEETPLMTKSDKQSLKQVIEVIDKHLVQTGKAYWQLGKTVCHTLFAIHPLTVNDIEQAVNNILRQDNQDIITVRAEVALNIQPKHITKGTGLEWLTQVTGIDQSTIAGAGDSKADVDFLKLIGYPAAPINASEDVKAVAHYVSPYATTAGLNDILDYWGV